MKEIYKKYGNYDLHPYKTITGLDEEAFSGYDSILEEIFYKAQAGKRVIVCDLYPGTDKEEILNELRKLNPVKIIDTDLCKYEDERLKDIFRDSLSEDRVFGIMTHKSLSHCFDPDRLLEAGEQTKSRNTGIILVIGVGASLVTRGDLLLYFDMARWEIQLRYRNGMSNWLVCNSGEPVLSKYKIGFFIEWRLADQHKKELFETMDYIVDTNTKGKPNMITGHGFCQALKAVSAQPFRTQPYFDPGVWGGQWMKEVFGLNQEEDNFAWSFDGVPEENSLNLKFGDVVMELPCMDLTLYCPHELLGEKVHGRFGAEFPIRFDLLDTMGGGNLSLQVHPLTEYIQKTFGMHYTQDESYYILDSGEEACVYLGLKENISPEAMEKELLEARAGKTVFEAEKYVNKIPVKKHDHVLIPAGTIHCSGKNTMVLEISATPYIFTFKLWDWGRIGLDGLPRPIHIEHGMKNIQWDRTTQWVKTQLIDQQEVLEHKDGVMEERTGLHCREFIETRRYTIEEECKIHMEDSVYVLNLVEGESAVIEPGAAGEDFEPFEVHYGETFIVPAKVGDFIIKAPHMEAVKVVCAWVR